MAALNDLLASAIGQTNGNRKTTKICSPHVQRKPRDERGFLWAELNSSQARESSDKPRLNAFCRVAPSLRFNVRAMLAARVFFLAAVFKVRTSVAVHARRFAFLAMLSRLRCERTDRFVAEVTTKANKYRGLVVAQSHRLRTADLPCAGISPMDMKPLWLGSADNFALRYTRVCFDRTFPRRHIVTAILVAGSIAKQSDQKLTDQNQASEDRLDIARRIYHEFCAQFPNRLIMLVDPGGCMVARSDSPSVLPPAEGRKLSN